MHVSCLGCDQIKPEIVKLICGHNICRSCLNRNSSQDHPKSSVRCDVCEIVTKVVQLVVSIPNREVSELLLKIQKIFGRKFHSSAMDQQAENLKTDNTDGDNNNLWGEEQKV